MGEHGPALLDGRQPQRVGVQVVGVSGQLPGDVAEQDADLAEPGGERGQLRVVGADGVQRALRPGDQGARVHALGVLGVARRARRARGSRRTPAPRRGPSRSASAASSASSPAQRLGGGDLLEAEPQQVGLLGALARPGGQLVQLGRDLAQPPVGGPVLGQRYGDGVARVPVERLALPGRAQQSLLVGLAVHRDEVVGEFGEQPHRHGTAADVRA